MKICRYDVQIYGVFVVPVYSETLHKSSLSVVLINKISENFQKFGVDLVEEFVIN